MTAFAEKNEALKNHLKKLEDARVAVLMDQNDYKNPVKPYTGGN